MADKGAKNTGGGKKKVTPRSPDARTAIPTPVRIAGWIASAQGLAGVGFATYVVIHALTGFRDEDVAQNPYGLAAWFFIITGGVLAAGIGLLRGRRWGRGLVILAELLLIGVGWYATVPSGQPLWGIPVILVSVVGLVCLFHRDAMEWYQES